MYYPYYIRPQTPYVSPYGMQNGATTAGTVPPPYPPSSSTIPGVPQGMPSGTPGQLPLEQSFIENILRLNLGKIATVYMTFENNTQWNAKVFKGVVEAAGRDHLIIRDPQSNIRYLLLMVNLDYITFDEELNYVYPYTGPQPPQSR